jgi:hypothetical protein
LFPKLANLMLQCRGFLGMSQHCLNAVKVRRLYKVVAGARAQRGNRAIHGGVARNYNYFRGFGLVQLTQKLDAFAIRQPEIGQEHIGTLTPKLDACVANAMGAGHGKALHPRDLL